MDEESKIARGPRTNQEFSSAAASSPNIVRAQTGKQSSTFDDKKSLPFVSQICFNTDGRYLACLISGSVNRVIVYELKTGKVKPSASETFPLQYIQEAEPASPTVGDHSRYTEKSRMSMRSYYHNSVTQISFIPKQPLFLCFTGPNGRIDYRKVVPG